MHPALKYVLDPALFCAVCRQPRTQALSTTLLAGGKSLGTRLVCRLCAINLVPRACDPREGNEGSGIIRFREDSDWPLKWMRSSILATIPGFRQRIIPEPSFPSQGSQARGTRLVRYIKAACLLNYKGKFFQILSYSKVTVYSVQRIVLRWPRLSCFRVRLLRERIVRFSY